MTYKEDLQAEATELGIEFVQRTTIAELEELIEAHEAEEAGPDLPNADILCPVCNKPADHVHATHQKGV